MRFLQPHSEQVTVTFLVPLVQEAGKPVTYREEQREFVLRENLQPQAKEFLTLLSQLTSFGEDASEIICQLVQHTLAHPADERGQLSLEDVKKIPDSVQVQLIDLQGDLYGFSSEDQRLGKKLQPLLQALLHQKIPSAAVRTTSGPSAAPSSDTTGE